MHEWTGSDQMLEHPMQKQVILLLLHSLLEWSLACFERFGFFIVLQLFSQHWDLFGDWTCMLWSLEVLWVDFVWWQVLVSFRDCCQFRQSNAQQTSEGVALKHALVCMLSAFRCFSCWFGLRCTWNCRSPLVDAQTRSVSRHEMKFPVATDVLGLFCAVSVSLLGLSSHTLQTSCGSCHLSVCLLRFGIWFST